MTSPGLPKIELPYYQKPVSATTHPRVDRPNTTRTNLHQVRHTVGVQQRLYQGRRQMERRIQNQLRPL